MGFFSRSKGPSGFSYSSTAEEVTHGIDASGLTAIVTGGSSGIGAETARVLALNGAHVIMGVRNMAAGNQVREAIAREIPAAKVDVMELDLSSLASVKKFASEFHASANPLHILMYYSRRDYSQSKLANILHTIELSRRLKEDGVNITANSLHPGAITTNLFRSPGFVEGVLNILGKYVFKNVQQGAATTCYVALHPQVKGISGEYFVDSNISKATTQATDMDLAKRLWDFSTNLVNSKLPESMYGVGRTT